MKLLNYFVYSPLLWLIFVTSSLIIACDSSPQSTLRLGTNAWLGYEPLYLARELGFWSSTQIDLVEYLSSSETIRAFRNNEIDAVALTLDEILLLLQDEIELNVILVTDISLGGDVILARPGISKVKDLAGQRVAVESGALGAYILTRALEMNGLSIADVEIVHQTANEHVHTFENDVADAVIGCEPERSVLLKKGAQQIFDSSFIPGEIVDVIAVRKDYLVQNPKQIQMLLKGWFDATRYLKNDLDDAAVKMSKRMLISKEDVIKSLSGLKIPSLEENLQFLAGKSPLLNTTAAKLNNIMLANNLINTTVKFDSLPVSRPLNKLEN